MRIKRTLDTSDATYDLLDLTKAEFELLHRAYVRQIHEMYNGPTDKDLLLNKFNAMSGKDSLEV